MATGVHLPSLELRIHLGADGLPQRPAVHGDRSSFGWFVFAGHHQPDPQFHGLSGAERFRDDGAVIQWHALKAGSSLPRHVTYSAHEAPLTGIVRFPSASQTQHWLEDLFEQVQLREATRAVA
jgi:hypothetical protein